MRIKISLLVLAILLIPAIVLATDLQFKYVSYSFSGYEWSDMKEELLINKYVNQAIKENPGWSLSHFFPCTHFEDNVLLLGRRQGKSSKYKFEIIIYLSREVEK